MRHMAKRAMSLLLALLLCLTLFPATALAEEGTMRPVENGEDGGLSGTPAHTEEVDPESPVGDGVLDVPADAPAALPQEPTADEIQSVAASGSCGENLTWTLDESGLLTISGSGAMTDWDYQGAPWYRQRESIREIHIDVGVISIGNYAFSNCSNLTIVSLPESATSIGDWSFIDCSSLTSVTIPEGVTRIGGRAFCNCGGLTRVTIPSSVTNIGIWAFSGCSSLTNVTIPDSVTTIGDYAFSSCGSLTSVTIPSSVTCINECVFLGCTSLTSVTIPSSVTIIGNNAFANCWSLTNVTIPSSITQIELGGFFGCYQLERIAIPASVTSIGEFAFSGCSDLKTISFFGDAPTIASNIFNPIKYSSGTQRTVRTTALYPIDNPTWTSDELQNYGAEKLTWVGYRDEAKAYTIHFDANGGSDAPEDQIKGHNVDILLTDAVPTREDASFLGWSTQPDATEQECLPGDSFSRNADTTLYAVWKQEAPVLPTEAVLTLGSAKVCAGQEFTVDLSMENNPGLMYLSFSLDYDADSLEFLGAEEVLFTGWTVNKEKNFLTWDADGDRRDNGTLLRLRFLAKEEARTGETAIALTDLFATNYAEELLGIGSVPGEVMILPHTPGDVNGDGAVDGRDLVRLRKYLVGVPGTEIIEANANVNGDDVIDILDLIRLRKYLAKDDVILE